MPSLFFSPLIIKSITGGHNQKKNPNLESDSLNVIWYFLIVLMMIGVGKSIYIFKDRFYYSVLVFIVSILLGSTLSSFIMSLLHVCGLYLRYW